jgi:hypothetical protein
MVAALTSFAAVGWRRQLANVGDAARLSRNRLRLHIIKILHDRAP